MSHGGNWKNASRSTSDDPDRSHDIYGYFLFILMGSDEGCRGFFDLGVAFTRLM
jgi:hypothetical protein